MWPVACVEASTRDAWLWRLLPFPALDAVPNLAGFRLNNWTLGRAGRLAASPLFFTWQFINLRPTENSCIRALDVERGCVRCALLLQLPRSLLSQPTNELHGVKRRRAISHGVKGVPIGEAYRKLPMYRISWLSTECCLTNQLTDCPDHPMLLEILLRVQPGLGCSRFGQPADIVITRKCNTLGSGRELFSGHSVGIW